MDDLLNQVIELFKQKYTPAKSVEEATDFLDTNEIFTAIENIAPGSGIEKETLFELLSQEGYIFAAEPNKINFNLKWLLIKQY